MCNEGREVVAAVNMAAHTSMIALTEDLADHLRSPLVFYRRRISHASAISRP